MAGGRAVLCQDSGGRGGAYHRSALPCVGGGKGVRYKVEKKFAISEAFDIGENEDQVISKDKLFSEILLSRKDGAELRNRGPKQGNFSSLDNITEDMLSLEPLHILHL